MGLGFNHFLLCILSLFLNYSQCISHLHSPKGSQNKGPLAYLEDMIGARKGGRTNGIPALKKYLHGIGYIDNVNQTNADFFDDNLETALKKYQRFYKLPVSGILDAPTVKKLATPRCGVPDFKTDSDISPQYTFFPGSPTWPPNRRNLTYAFLPGVNRRFLKPIIAATRKWQGVSPFKFIHTRDISTALVKVGFFVRDHGDGSPFDGNGGAQAHAFAPQDGRLHFDGDEKWIDGIAKGYLDVQTVALHELGHVLGLGHSADPNSVMYAYILRRQRKGLTQDDINGIHALYHEHIMIWNNLRPNDVLML